MSILELQEVVKKFANKPVVNNVSMTIEQGEFFTMLGPSGCGKTTILRMIAGFEKPDSGVILLDGQDISKLPPEKRPIHTIFQSYALFPHLTVFDNIAFPLKMSNWTNDKIKSRVNDLMHSVQLEEFTNRYPEALSGGQKQRVAIARALADRPRMLLLDEPLSALDARLREHMHFELVKLQEESGVTFIYVTHDQTEALALSNRIAVVNNGQIEQIGNPHDIYSYPINYYVADFIGKCNLLDATVTAQTEYGITIDIANSFQLNISANLAVGTEGWFAVRPEKIKANWDYREQEDSAVCKAKVKGYYYYGDATLYDLLLENNTTIQCMLANNRPYQAEFFANDDEVFITINPQSGSFLLN